MTTAPYYTPKFYVPFMLLVFVLVTAGVIMTLRFTADPAGAPTGSQSQDIGKPINLEPCKTEDSTATNCYWDAKTRGNGTGYSFIVWGDQILYGDTYYEGGQPNPNSEFSMEKGYDPKDKYLQGDNYKAPDYGNDDYNTESDYPKSYPGNGPEGDSPNGPEYNSKETKYFNCYNDQYKNWHHEEGDC